MKNNFIITEEDKKKILNQHITATKNQYLMVEAIKGSDMSSIDRMKVKYPKGIQVPSTIKASGRGVFSNGIDEINKGDSKINEIVLTISDLLKNSKGKINITVDGGASSVGEAQGYDNTALAKRRRDNLIKFIKQTWPNEGRLVITPGKVTVGKATVKDSPEAKKEQFVSAKINGQSSGYEPISGVQGDNTNVSVSNRDMPNVDMNFTPKKGKTKRVCVQIPEQYVELFKMSLREFKKENSLSSLPFSVSNVK
jgi:hypothetical protein